MKLVAIDKKTTGGKHKRMGANIPMLKVTNSGVIFNDALVNLFEFAKSPRTFVFAQDEDKPEDFYIHFNGVNPEFYSPRQVNRKGWFWALSRATTTPPKNVYKLSVNAIQYEGKSFFKLTPDEIS